MNTGILLAGPDTPRDEWLALRRPGIGASDIAAVLGVSPWDSPFSLYWRKKLRTETEMNEAMEWGTRHEVTISAKFAENHPEYRLERAGLYRHADHEWMMATPDRIAHRLDGNSADLVQIKTGYSWNGWGTPGTDQVPAHYRAQVMQEMAVYGAPVCWLAVLVGGNSYREYRVRYDPVEVGRLVDAGKAFLYLLGRDIPPDIDGASSTTDTLKQLHPDLVDEAVTIPIELGDALAVRSEFLADAQASYDEVLNRIRGHMGNCRYAVSDGRKIAVRSVYETQRVDTKRLREDHPDLVEQYQKTTTVNKLAPIRESK